MNYSTSNGFASEEQYDAVIEAIEAYTERNYIVLEDCFDSLYVKEDEDGKIILSFKLQGTMDFLELSYNEGPQLTVTKRYGRANTTGIGGMLLEAVGILSGDYFDVLEDVSEAMGR